MRMGRFRRFATRMVAVMGAIAIVLALLAALGVWWAADTPTFPTRHNIDFMNVTKFIESPRHLSLEPIKTLEACQHKKVEVLVMVPTAPDSTKARSAVRESWGAYLPLSWALIFYVGAPEQDSLQEGLSSESATHQDIAQDHSFTDTYATLTLKTLAILDWARKSCSTSKFIIKVDDDVFLNIPRLLHLISCIDVAMNTMYSKRQLDYGITLLSVSPKAIPKMHCEEVDSHHLVSHFVDALTHEYESYIFGGYVYRGVKPDRDPMSKWHLYHKTYPKDVLPPFLSGTAYILTQNVVPYLLEEAKRTPLIRLEDVYLSGLVGSERLKLRLTHLDGWSRFRPRYEGPCVHQRLLTAHGFSPAELRTATHAVMALSEGVCDGLLTKVALAINDIVSSVFPKMPTEGILNKLHTDIKTVI